ncbi:hypothetical protein [Streptomyces sp. NPDC127084]|uniref:hypothetical protein n=1 Tax=Streptomyces sp. NPDC127084 TaxID=3347133 RepID=UPI00364949BC
MTDTPDDRRNHRRHEADWELLALEELAELAWGPASANEFAPRLRAPAVVGRPDPVPGPPGCGEDTGTT